MSGYIGATTFSFDVTEADIKGDIKSTDASPEVTLQNTTEEDTDGGRESKITFKGEQSGGEITTLAQIQASHDGTADDEKGDLIFSTNDGSDGNTPTERMRIDSAGNVTVSNAIVLDNKDTTLSGGEVLGKIEFQDNDGGSASAGVTSKIECEAVGSFGASALTLSTSGSSGGARTALTEAMRIDNSGNVGIGTNSPANTLHLTGSSSTPSLRLGSTSLLYYWDIGRDNATTGDFIFNQSINGTVSERMRIDSSGNLLVGQTTASSTDVGFFVRPDGFGSFTRDGSRPLYLSRLTSDGDILQFRKDSTSVGEIQVTPGSVFFNGVVANSSGLAFFNDNRIHPVRNRGRADNIIDFGTPSYRFDDIYATNGSIQTSDQNEKQQIASLTGAEITAAKAISKLFKTFKWNDSVTEKGDAARTHTGVIAQEVEQAMTDAGLNAGDYAFFISTTWWETQTEVPAVEADEENGVEAREAYTRTDTYETSEEAPEGATERNRKGIRYPQLLSFIGAATEQRLASIESRLDALESA